VRLLELDRKALSSTTVPEDLLPTNKTGKTLNSYETTVAIANPATRKPVNSRLHHSCPDDDDASLAGSPLAWLAPPFIIIGRSVSYFMNNGRLVHMLLPQQHVPIISWCEEVGSSLPVIQHQHTCEAAFKIRIFTVDRKVPGACVCA